MSAPAEEQKHSDAAQQEEELEFDTDSVKAPRREFTAEERAAQLLAQQEEDAAIAKEAAELLAEQKKVHAQIRARKVAFGAAQPLDSASETVVRAGETVERDEYSFHDGKLTRVLFVEAACDSLAPAAGAFVRKYTAHVLGVTLASASLELTAPTGELQDVTVKAVEELSAKMPTARTSLGLLLERGGAQIQYAISLDAASQAALQSLSAAQLSRLGNPKLIHQAFARPTSAAEAEDTAKKVQTFAQELPDLLSFYA